MKKILFINIGNFGSTGSIVSDLAEVFKKNGYDVLKCYPDLKINKTSENNFIICSNGQRLFNNFLGMVFGKNGHFAKRTTYKLIKKINEYDPEIIHLHNIHSSFINYEILFNYLKNKKVKIFWTLHDCWAFTGRCPHFTMLRCDRWKSGCGKCPYPKFDYPRELFDHTKKNLLEKKKWFSNIKNMTIITPSNWLNRLVRESYLNQYQIITIYNWIDLKIFKCNPYNSIREKYQIPENDYIILGVSFGWNKKKGYDIFEKLAKMLPSKYHIFLIGNIEKEFYPLPENIFVVPRTNSKEELVDFYSAADLFVNPTREEVLGLVNLESLACGTPVLTFNSGGSPECIDQSSGCVVNCNEIDAMYTEIIRICETKPFRHESCIKRAEEFEKLKQCMKYFKLFDRGNYDG